MLLPSECYDKLKCSICDQYLSIFPIYMTKNGNKEPSSVCGRCQIPSDDENYLRGTIYENVTKNVHFPCMNRQHGCMEDLLPIDMEQHESTCQYRLQPCIFDCELQIPLTNMLEHFKTIHADLIIFNNSEFQMDTNNNSDIFKILQHEDEVFRLQYNFNQTTNHLKCILTPLGFTKVQQIYYGQINLKTDDAAIFKKFPNLIKNQLNSIDINVENLLQCGDKTNVDGIIKISTNNEQLNLTYDKNSDMELWSKLKCCQCNQSLYAPVFHCRNGHYGCSNCNNKMCPNCRINNRGRLQSIGSTVKNKIDMQVQPPLRDVLNRIPYQCQYGCGFIANSSDLRLHYNYCLNITHDCVLFYDKGCRIQKGRKNLIQHIVEEHGESIVKINEIVTLMIDSKTNRCNTQHKFIQFAGNSFKLIIQYVYPKSVNHRYEIEDYGLDRTIEDYPHILWRLEAIDTTGTTTDFKFEISLFNENTKKRITIKESCADLKLTDVYSINDTPCVWLCIDQLYNLIHANTLSFTINIFK